MPEHGQWLHSTLIYLAAAVVAVPLSRKLGLGSVIGYLVAGMAIGPWGLKLVSDPKQILEFAEFGVVLMLFLVGLELEPKRLWKNRRSIFGWGSLQYVGSTLALFAVALAAMPQGSGWRPALVAALALAMSSTAIGLAVLEERNALAQESGQGVLNTALLQDIVAIPVLALLPLLALSAGAVGGPASAGGQAGTALAAAKAIGAIAGVILGGRLALPPLLRWVARSATPEIFTAASLAIVVGIAALMHAIGLSMALGAFLAGVLLAESEYKHELEADIEPFKGLLLGLFFIAVGMGIDFGIVAARPLAIVAVVLVFLLLKALVLWAIARAMPIPVLERHLFVILLAQGGEFGFVVLQTAGAAALIDPASASIVTAAISVSMLLTPLLLILAERYWVPRLEGCVPAPSMKEIDEPQSQPVIIAGFGRYGQTIGRLLDGHRIPATILEHDARQVELLRRFGWRVFYGDATRLELLRLAGAAEAAILVVAIDDVEQSLEVVRLARRHFPRLQVVARARNREHWYALHDLGVRMIERETLDASLMSARSVLELLGFEPHRARKAAMQFRRHDLDQLVESVPHRHDMPRRISMAQAGRQQLEALLARGRARDRGAHGETGWVGETASGSEGGG